MKTILSLCFVILCSANMFGQKTSTVVQHKIKTIVEKVINFEDGLKDKRTLQHSEYDAQGRLLEFKDWTKDGKIKEWSIYTYNSDGTIETLSEFNSKGKLESKHVYEYDKGLKVKRSTFDAKDRLVKEKYYEYSFYE